MDHNTVGIMGISALLVLMAMGMHIAFAMFTVGVGGLFLLTSQKAVFHIIATQPYASLAHYTLSTIPMFILMGYFAFQGGLVRDLFQAARQWVGKLPGGLAMASVMGCTGFAFCSGSSLASAAVMGRTVIPEMRKQGYNPSFAAGTVAAAGTLAAMIPPSIGLIIYGIVTDTSISKILVGGIIPGLISASIYMVGIYVIACIKPGLAPRSTAVPWKERIKATKGVWGVFVLAFVVLGGIYTGQFSPTEAGAAGATGALLLGIIARQINPGNFWTALKDTAITTAQIFIIIAGALMFSQMLTFSRVPYVFVKWVLQLPAPPMAILIGVMGMYIVLGTFMEPLGIMFITLPVIFPAIIALKFNPIWFGILMTKTMEIGLITPPVGMNVYALKSATPDISLEDIFKGAAWFVIMDVLTLALLISFPSIVTFLPNLMQ